MIKIVYSDSEKNFVCPSCGNAKHFMEVNDSIVCCECGEILEDNIFTTESPPYYGLENIQLKSNTEAPTPLYITYIRSRTIRFIGKEKKRGYKEKSILSKEEKLFNKAKDLIETYATPLGLSIDYKQLALIILYNYVLKKKLKSKMMEKAAIASIYLSLKIRNQPKPLKLFAKKFGIKRNELSKICRDISTRLKLKVSVHGPEDYIKSFGKELKLSYSCTRLALKIIKKVREKKKMLFGDSRSMAAAAIYAASELLGESRDRKEIAEVAAVTELTIKKRYNEIKNILNLNDFSEILT